MLRTLSRNQAMILTLSLAAACLWASLAPPPAKIGTLAQDDGYSDMRLYHDIAARVSSGEDYYQAAATLHRAHGFPTRPFVTVREPTLALMAAHFGWQNLQAVLAALLMAATALWYRQLTDAAPVERIVTAACVLLGGAMVSQPLLAAQHELWAGLLVALALPLVGGRQWPVALALAGAALAIRELTLPFALLALAFALAQRRWREAAGWAVLIAAFGAAMILHAAAVAAQALPTDLPSQGWSGLRGGLAPLRDVVDVSLLNRLPAPLALPAALLGLLGWAAVPLRQAYFALLWFLGYGLMLAIFARTQNFYWAIVLLPAWFIGFAFLPRALRDLAQAMLAGRKSAL